jgi:hypothetical protein
MLRYCANCGTEVEDNAVFCPTCGQPIDQAAETEMPAAPAWPDQAPDDRSPSIQVPPPAWARRDDESAPAAAGSEPEAVGAAASTAVHDRTQRPPVPEAPRSVAPQRASTSRPSVPFTMPLTLSAWLIGGGALLAALGVLIALFGGFVSPIDLVVLVVLIGIAATVFFSASVPAVPHLRLIVLAVVLVAFGMALDRIGLGGAGAGELLFFLGIAAAAIGALLLELGRDQPLGGPGL